MGKNAKLNRELAKLGMALSREDLYYYMLQGRKIFNL